MGFFSKIWKSVKSGIKSIGKGIKSAAAKIGKFMDKIGVVGQIALMFAMPYLGGMLASGVGTLAASANPILAGVGKVLQTAGKFAHTAGNAFKTVTDGVMNFAKNVGQGFVNQVGSTFGADNLIFSKGPASIGQGFDKWMKGVAHDAANITSPFRATARPVTESISANYDRASNFTPRPEGIVTERDPFSMELRDNNAASTIADLENKTNKSFFDKVSDFTKKTLEDAPKRVVEGFTDQFTAGVASSALTSAGLGPEAPKYVTNVNNIPKFDSTPVNQAYEKNGFGYGALPENRIQFFAAQNAGGDFGMSSFSNFTRLRG